MGSVGTACWVFLFKAGEGDPLFLQIKEARPSVLERYAGRSSFRNHGERVVSGYRLMQRASDMFLGWGISPRRHRFVRQLRDIKVSVRVETFRALEMEIFATWFGRALASSRARSGGAAMLRATWERATVFDKALAYADQNERDHAALERGRYARGRWRRSSRRRGETQRDREP